MVAGAAGVGGINGALTGVSSIVGSVWGSSLAWAGSGAAGLLGVTGGGTGAGGVGVGFWGKNLNTEDYVSCAAGVNAFTCI